MTTITAVLPAFNEEVSIGSIVLRTRQHAHRVIVVDDGSADRTAQVDEMAGGEIKMKPQMNTDTVIIILLIYISRSPATPTPSANPNNRRDAHDHHHRRAPCLQ